jgi:3-isopropylmalate/(R)-2-methylmalate dehydratase large subunit
LAADGTLFEKIWRRHVVADEGDGFALLHVDRQVVVDANGRALPALAARGLAVRNPELTFATADHLVPTDPHHPDRFARASRPMAELREGTARHGIKLFDIGEAGHGIVHVIAPEMGISQPGMTICVGDSHTCTNGALGALAWGVGQGEIVHILATQTTRQKKPNTMRIRLDGTLPAWATGKDLILYLIGQVGVGAGNGYAVEYAGAAIRALPMEGRFTVCNMSVEFGARYGMIAPDEETFAYLDGRPYAPKGVLWEQAVADWRTLPSDADAVFDAERVLDVSGLVPQVTWGNSLDAVLPVDGRIPDPDCEPDAARRADMAGWLAYMDLSPGQAIAGTPVDQVFIGSCTNSRISDLRAAAALVKGRKVAATTRAWAVPGSVNVKRQAEAEGLDAIFRSAGFEWREPGCSMCVGMNGDTVPAGQRSVSTSNRSFAGRQGPGSRTHVASPLVAAASALAGAIADPRKYVA